MMQESRGWGRDGIVNMVGDSASNPGSPGAMCAGRSWEAPILVAPMAMQKMAHPDGECGTMRATAANGMGMVRVNNSYGC